MQDKENSDVLTVICFKHLSIDFMHFLGTSFAVKKIVIQKATGFFFHMKANSLLEVEFHSDCAAVSGYSTISFQGTFRTNINNSYYLFPHTFQSDSRLYECDSRVCGRGSPLYLLFVLKTFEVVVKTWVQVIVISLLFTSVIC